MHHFQYRDNELFCEEVSIQEISAKIGTPFYLYSYATLKRHLEAFNAAFEDVPKLICFSAKANSNLAVLKIFADMGCGLDIVSGGELYRGPNEIENAIYFVQFNIMFCSTCSTQYNCFEDTFF